MVAWLFTCEYLVVRGGLACILVTLAIISFVTNFLHVKVKNPPFFFFFQAEDGIRYGRVTGVQTCALPISFREHPATPEPVQYSGQLLGKGRKHKRSKLNGEYPFTKWGSYLGIYDGPDPRDAADATDAAGPPAAGPAAGHPAVGAAGRRRAGSPLESHEAAGDRVTGGRVARIRRGKHLRAALP